MALSSVGEIKRCTFTYHDNEQRATLLVVHNSDFPIRTTLHFWVSPRHVTGAIDSQGLRGQDVELSRGWSTFTLDNPNLALGSIFLKYELGRPYDYCYGTISAGQMKYCYIQPAPGPRVAPLP